MRAEGPSVARLINQSVRRPERSESRANSSEKYIYIHILYISMKVSVLLPGNSANAVERFIICHVFAVQFPLVFVWIDFLKAFVVANSVVLHSPRGFASHVFLVPREARLINPSGRRPDRRTRRP